MPYSTSELNRGLLSSGRVGFAMGRRGGGGGGGGRAERVLNTESTTGDEIERKNCGIGGSGGGACVRGSAADVGESEANT